MKKSISSKLNEITELAHNISSAKMSVLVSQSYVGKVGDKIMKTIDEIKNEMERTDS